MSEPPAPDERDILDAVWSDFRAAPPGTGSPPEWAYQAATSPTPGSTGRRAAGGILFVTVVACCDYLVASHGIAGPGWAVVAAALAGAVAGFLIELRYPFAGLLAGAVTGAGSTGAAAWAAGRLAQPDPVILAVAALAGLAPGLAVYFGFHWFQSRRSRTRSPSPAGPPIAVIYDPPADLPDEQTVLLEERLLHLCKQDRRLFDRLVRHERMRYPGRRRAEHLRLAIDHFDQDNR